MKIEPINPPEVITQDGQTVTLTHKCTSILIAPSDRVALVTITVRKGWIRSSDGGFQDWGPMENAILDPQGYADFLAASGGDFKISALRPAIDKRASEIKKAEADAQAAAQAQAQQATAQATAQAQAQTQKTTVSSTAKPAGPDAVAT